MIRGLLESAGIASILQPTGLNGPMINEPLLPPGAQRVMVSPSEAEAARRLLAETLVEEEPESGAETANALNLEDGSGRGPRNYGLIGAMARIWLFSLAAVALAFGIFLLLRVL